MRRAPSSSTSRSGPPAAVVLLAACGLVAAPAAPAAPASPATQPPQAASAHGKVHEDRAFGPFDAGASRPVTRQGAPGRARRAHPAVGRPDKVPGEGPPPPPLRTDPDVPELALTAPNKLGGSGLSSSPLWLAALLYQHVLTRLDGPRCQHLPTCSRFASQAVARHGAVGVLMGLDRLIRPTESSALRRLPEVEGWGGVRGFDPVENYEFWRSGRFTGLPVPVAEEPLALPSRPAANIPAPPLSPLETSAP